MVSSNGIFTFVTLVSLYKYFIKIFKLYSKAAFEGDVRDLADVLVDRDGVAVHRRSHRLHRHARHSGQNDGHVLLVPSSCAFLIHHQGELEKSSLPYYYITSDGVIGHIHRFGEIFKYPTLVPGSTQRSRYQRESWRIMVA